MEYNDYPDSLPDAIVRKMAMEYKSVNAQNSDEESKAKTIADRLNEVEAYMLAVANITQRRFVREKFLERVSAVKEEKSQLITHAKVQNHDFPSFKPPRFNSFNNCYHGYLCSEMRLIRELIECCCSRFCNPALYCNILTGHFNNIDCYFKNEF